ncbi:MAG: M3 family oligoendopeptidase [Clostridiales bacterium]|nr:M3 family oligoendopeptidase [Clostridiales bacterium]
MEKELWTLTPLYSSFNSTAFTGDMEKLKTKIDELIRWVEPENLTQDSPVTIVETYLNLLNELSTLSDRLRNFAELTLSQNAEDESAMKYCDLIDALLAKLALPETIFQRWFATLPDQKELFLNSCVCAEHQFYLSELAMQYSHSLSEKEELLLANMKTTGSSAWSKLHDQLTSTLNIPIKIHEKEEVLPLPAIRNLAYDSDSHVRKTAYIAEIQGLEKIALSSAACLNAIKGEVLSECDMRHYSSPLQMTLDHSRMDQEMLTIMLECMKEVLPAFEAYFLKKAKILGHTQGLPFYDLFAPIGKNDMTFTYQEAKNFIVENFSSFSHSLGEYAAYAFDHHWIDAYPRIGKQGGAFCCNLHSIKESRILTNFTGSFSDVITLAHELGHGYHGACLDSQSALNSDYPMPIAETASTFCETIVKNAVLKKATGSEKLMLLENDLSDHAQVIVDIFSRFLFENAVFEERKNGPLSVRQLNDLMLNAQKQTYGKGLSKTYMHPYMWICKSHYYDADFNYYNFPYAFGLLFAKGLYALYLKDSASFPSLYDTILSATGNHNLSDVAKLAGINLHTKSFWKESIDILKNEIQEFCNL